MKTQRSMPGHGAGAAALADLSAPATPVSICAGGAVLQGDLRLPATASGTVIFAHGSGSSRHSPRNRFVAEALHEAGFGTLLLDLLTQEEEADDSGLNFDIGLLAKRLAAATLWLENRPECTGMRIGYFGASTGSAAALMAAATLGSRIRAIVSRGGRPDLAAAVLPKVVSPTLLIVGGYDQRVLTLNEDACKKLNCEKDLRVIPCATHLFEEPGKLEQVAQLAAYWFGKHLGTRR